MHSLSRSLVDSIRRARGKLDESEWAPPGDLEAWQLAKVRSLVRHAKRSSQAYGSLYAHAAPIRDWDTFRQLPRAEKGQLTGARSSGPDVLFRARTSGTTGEVMTVDRTTEVESWRAASQWREYDWSGVDVSLKGAVIRWPIGPESRGWDAKLRGVPLAHWDFGPIGPMLGLGPGLKVDNTSHPDAQAEIVRDFGAEILCGMPTILADIADSGSGIRPAAVFCISEVLTARDRERIERGFGAPTYNVYAAVEVGRIAFECPTKSGLHVHSESVLFEVVDDANEQTLPGEPGTALLTALHNRATPLIRYQIGDMATMGATCACGRSLPLIKHLDGKTINRVKTASGALRVASRAVYALESLPGVSGFQIRQDEIDDFTILLAKRAPFTGEEASTVADALAKIVGVQCSVASKTVDEIPRAPSGKVVRVVVAEKLLQN